MLIADEASNRQKQPLLNSLGQKTDKLGPLPNSVPTNVYNEGFDDEMDDDVGVKTPSTGQMII